MALYFIFLNLAMFALACAVLFYAFRQHRRRQQNQHKLLQHHADLLRHGRWFRIRYADNAYYHRWLKLFPWQNDGILHLAEDTLTLLLADNRIIRLPIEQTGIQWQGMRFWPNGLLYWFSLQHAGQTHYLTSETGVTVLQSQTGTRDILQQITELFTGQAGPQILEISNITFALEKNRGSLITLILFFGFLFYFLTDNFFVLDEIYVTWPPRVYFVVGGLIALLGSFYFMDHYHVPRNEKIALSLLLCISMILALYPGLRRLNQLTDSTGIQVFSYTFSDTRLLIPDDSTLPRVTLAMNKHYHEYWAQFKSGDSYELSVRKGGLGFYQIDIDPVNTQMREFYRRQRELKQQARESE